MRISDIMINNGFVNNVAKAREEIQKLSTQISTSQRVQKPSDAPASAAKILRLGNQSSQNDIYSKNITNSMAFLNETTFSLEAIQSALADSATIDSLRDTAYFLDERFHAFAAPESQQQDYRQVKDNNSII